LGKIAPQSEFQSKALSTPADIAIIGGSAGGGKSWTLTIEPLKWVKDKNMRTVIFKRTMANVRASGSIWDESKKWYSLFGGRMAESILKWRFESGAEIDFEGIEHEKDLENWQGAQIPLIIFDELTTFTRKMFFYMLSRNRGVCSFRSYIRASCNPDSSSWVKDFISWWIGPDGFPIKERDGVLRYMYNYKDTIIWGDTKDEVISACPQAFNNERAAAAGVSNYDLIKSVTFIKGDVYDNKILLQNDPGYLGNLSSLSEEDQKRFLEGNWNVTNDGLALYETDAIDRIFVGGSTDDVGYSRRYITCDAAKFGRDLCVIAVWYGWTIVHTSIFHLSSPQDIKSEIESLRAQFNVPRANTSADQDGVGGDVVKLGGYQGFIANRQPAKDETTRHKENYRSRKDQCYFKSAERCNSGELKIVLLQSTVKIYDAGSKHPRFSTSIKWKGEMVDVKTLIKNHLKSVRRGESDFEGGLIKLRTNSKEEQKDILGGDSPDFSDVIMMREDFELNNYRTGKFKVHN